MTREREEDERNKQISEEKESLVKERKEAGSDRGKLDSRGSGTGGRKQNRRRKRRIWKERSFHSSW